MGCESLDEFGDSSGNRRWQSAQISMAVIYLHCVCGEPPAGYKLEETWHECDMGGVGQTTTYSLLSLTWDEPFDILDEGWDYIERCNTALEIFNEAIDWQSIRPGGATQNE
jgi:hypothetical protein